SAKATGSSQEGQRPPGPTRRQKVWQSSQIWTPRKRRSHSGHWYTTRARLGVVTGTGSVRAGAWRRRILKHALEREQDVQSPFQVGHLRLTGWPADRKRSQPADLGQMLSVPWLSSSSMADSRTVLGATLDFTA